MEHLIAGSVAAVAAALAYITSNKHIAQKIRFFDIASNIDEEFSSIELKNTQLLAVTIVTGILSYVAVLNLLNGAKALEICRMTIALLCMVGAGCFDLRLKRIPNIFPLLMLISAILLFGVGAILKQEGIITLITSGAIAAVAIFVILTLTAVLTKEGIGAGDIKLISALALTIGVYLLIEALFYASVFCSLAAIVLLLIKKKDTSKAVPFGPFLLLGYIITLITNYV